MGRVGEMMGGRRRGTVLRGARCQTADGRIVSEQQLGASQSPARHRRGRVTPAALRQQQVNGCRRQPAPGTREEARRCYLSARSPSRPLAPSAGQRRRAEVITNKTKLERKKDSIESCLAEFRGFGGDVTWVRRRAPMTQGRC